MTDVDAHRAQAMISACTDRVVLIGTPSPLRSAVARELRASAALLACLGGPAHLPRALSAVTTDGGAGLGGATVVVATVPRLPGLASGLRHWCRSAALAADFSRAVTAARKHGAARIIVLSTAFRYDDDRGVALYPGSPTLTAAETAQAAAAEAGARLFSRLGGESVVLRLGWTCGREDAITRRVVSAARRGWRLVDADPAAWVPMIAEADAARAVRPALTVPPGTYNLTDGCPVTQGMLNARLEAAAGQALHGLDDPGWSYRGALFGRSRKITGTAFGALTGWRPQVAPAADSLAAMLRAC
jgi:hypothetical protein